jgi:radical SAM protein with 4Fe4S-binding SPASM domain
MVQTPEKISFMFEVAEPCNQRCSFCYNAWRTDGESAKKQLSTADALRVLERVIEETPCHSISLSGGEPFLRSDIFELIAFIKDKNKKACVISNGLVLSEEKIQRCMSAGVDVFQISLLGDNPEIHNRLTGVRGFERTVDAIFDIKKAGGRVHVFFVATAENIARFRGVLELCVLLGVEQVSFGRFLPGGAGLEGWEALLPSPDAIDAALETAEEFGRKYGIAVSVANPVPPCLNDTSKYTRVKAGFCAVGRADHGFFAIDPEGNLKLCSHSPVVLGNLLTTPFAEIVRHSFVEQFENAVPEFCRDCPELASCRGGCRSSAHVCYGSVEREDPYLARWKMRARKPAGRGASSSGACQEVP